MTGATFWAAAVRDFVMVHGRDALSYLHSQVSQEVRDLRVGASVWSFVLEPTGKVDALVRVTRSGDSALVLDVDGGFGAALVERLRRFKIRVQADIEPIPWSCIAVRGPGAAGAGVAAEGAVALPAWWGIDAVDLVGPAPVPPAEVPERGAEALEHARVVAGWPAMGAEVTAATIPGETGLIDLAVSFTKGCYPGQELVERMDSRGVAAPRQLCRLLLPAGCRCAPGDRLWLHGEQVGELTSVAGDAALGFVRRGVPVPASAAVHEEPHDVPVRILPLR
jgi:folate-binding protein YgfZ